MRASGQFGLASTLPDGATALGSFTVAGATLLQGTLEVDGVANFDGNVDMDGQLDVAQAALFRSTIEVDGVANFDGNVDMDGDADIAGRLDVHGAALFSANLEVDGVAQFDGSVTGVEAHSDVGPWHTLNLANSQTDSDACTLVHSNSGDTGKRWEAIRAGTITGIRAQLSSINAGNDGTLKISVFKNGVEEVDNAITIELVDHAGGEERQTAALNFTYAAGDDISIRWTTTSWNATLADLLVWLEKVD